MPRHLVPKRHTAPLCLQNCIAISNRLRDTIKHSRAETDHTHLARPASSHVKATDSSSPRTTFRDVSYMTGTRAFTRNR